ncbi:MAG: C10 family peptidase [Bacteroidales bacterium]|nr:C10 family peptidase [Bacteroidales bacterium]
MSQVLYYLHYEIGKPTGLYHNIINTGRIYNDKNYRLRFLREDYRPNSNRWDLMKKSRYSSGYSSYVSDLMADVGNRVNMKYSFEVSGAWPSNQGFNFYGISCDKRDYAYSAIAAELNNDKPVIVVAWAGKGTYRKWFLGKKHTYYYDGHTWVIDGYKRKQRTYTYTYAWELIRDNEMLYRQYDQYDPYYNSRAEFLANPLYPGQIETTSTTSTSTFLLMNWGWDDNHDYGEYSIGGNGTKWSSNKDYQYKKEIYYDFR